MFEVHAIGVGMKLWHGWRHNEINVKISNYCCKYSLETVIHLRSPNVASALAEINRKQVFSVLIGTLECVAAA